MITIIDYQISNLFSVKHACEHLGLEVEITSDPQKILKCKAAILPGVGAFGDAMHNLEKLELIQPIKEFIGSGKPFMGICLGMQLLFSQSDEFGHHQGLNIIPGKVVKFPAKTIDNKTIKIPQIGWNQIYEPEAGKWGNSPLKGLASNEFMYFVHSYFATPNNKEVILSLTDYEDIEYCSSVLHNNVFATQFHPEKSGQEGIKIYRNWALNIVK